MSRRRRRRRRKSNQKAAIVLSAIPAHLIVQVILRVKVNPQELTRVTAATNGSKKIRKEVETTNVINEMRVSEKNVFIPVLWTKTDVFIKTQNHTEVKAGMSRHQTLIGTKVIATRQQGVGTHLYRKVIEFL